MGSARRQELRAVLAYPMGAVAAALVVALPLLLLAASAFGAFDDLPDSVLSPRGGHTVFSAAAVACFQVAAAALLGALAGEAVRRFVAWPKWDVGFIILCVLLAELVAFLLPPILVSPPEGHLRVELGVEGVPSVIFLLAGLLHAWARRGRET